MAGYDEGIELTYRVWMRRLFGAKWLGSNASLDEYAVASWFEDNNIKYIYQAPMFKQGNLLHTDFRILYTTPTLCIEVQGDKWHSGRDQIALDMQRIGELEQQGAIVVQVFGHDIYKYSGFPAPTDRSFNKVMQAAMSYQELSRAQ